MPGHSAQGPWGAQVRGRRYSPCPPSCLAARCSLLADPVALGVLEGQAAHGGPGGTAERTGWVAGGGQGMFPVCHCGKGWTGPWPAPTCQQDKRMWGPCPCPLPGSCPSSPSPHQDITGSPGGPGGPMRPCGPCGDKASGEHPLQAGISTIWGSQPPQSHQPGVGHQSTHCLATVSLLALQGDRGKGLGAAPPCSAPHSTAAIGKLAGRGSMLSPYGTAWHGMAWHGVGMLTLGHCTVQGFGFGSGSGWQDKRSPCEPRGRRSPHKAAPPLHPPEHPGPLPWWR